MGESATASPTMPHRYTGEYWDEDSQLQYNRTRWYDTSTARFLSIDPFEGIPSNPASLHRYAYAHADPVQGSDPGGRFAMVMNTFPSINIASTVGSTYAAKFLYSLAVVSTGVISATFGMTKFQSLLQNHVVGIGIVSTIVRRCFNNGILINKNCGYNAFVIGDDYKEHQDLVADAINSGSPFSLTRREPEHKRAWLEAIRGCRGSVSQKVDCDEYPYASTHEGGFLNNALVGTRIISQRHNRGAGASLKSRFYTPCNIKGNLISGDQFYVIPISGLARTDGICK